MDFSQTRVPRPDNLSQTPHKLPKPKQWISWLVILLSPLVLAGGGIALWQYLGLSGTPRAEKTEQSKVVSVKQESSEAPKVPETQENAAPEKPQGVPVKLATVESSTIEESSVFVGNLEAQQGVALRPETSGRVTKIFVSAGDRVAPGTPILQLKSEQTQAELNAALANVNAARAARNTALAQLRAQEAERVSAVAELQLQNQQFQRTEFLVSQGALAQEQLDTVVRDRNAAGATLNAANERIRAAGAGLDEANAALSQAQAQAEAARENLQDKKVVAPIAGIIGDMAVKLGDYINLGDSLTTITQNQNLELELAVPVDRSDQLRVGLPIQLSRFQENEPIATGRISFVSPDVDPNTQTILAQASFPNPNGSLRNDLKVSSKVIWDQYTGVLIPTTAISRIGGKTFVYVAQTKEGSDPGQPQLIAQQKPVKLGEIQNNQYQVIEGVEPGEEIVVTGILNLSDGAPIMPESQDSSPTAFQ